MKEMFEVEQIEFKIGDIIEVTVANFAHFGVFCKCPNNYKGLIWMGYTLLDTNYVDKGTN